MNQKLVAIAIIALVIAGAGYWYFQMSNTPEDEVAPSAEGGLGAQIFEQAQNPLKDDIPETNPFAADTNPFDADTNPYKDTYKNPFQ